MKVKQLNKIKKKKLYIKLFNKDIKDYGIRRDFLNRCFRPNDTIIDII